MVSLVELSEVTEEGVKFKSPYDGEEILLSPEKSISIQNSLGLYSRKSFASASSQFVEWPKDHIRFSLSSTRVRHHDAAGRRGQQHGDRPAGGGGNAQIHSLAGPMHSGKQKSRQTEPVCHHPGGAECRAAQDLSGW